MNQARFKETEIGMIPADWEVKTINEISETSSGGTPSRSIKNYYEGDIRWFTTGELNDSYLFDSKEHISEKALVNSSAKIFPSGTLLIAMYGATIGKLGILKNESATNQACCALFCNNIISKYLFYWLEYDRTNIISLGSGAGQPNISQKIINHLKLPYPPSEEQEAIASTLTDIDSLIEGIDKLISKKQAIKIGAMQQLLTGNKRLRGFSGDWISKRLGKSCTIKARIGWQGLTTDEYLTSGDYYLITGTDFNDGHIDWNNCHYVSKERYEQDKNIQIRDHDVLITKDGTIGKVAFLGVIPKAGTLNSGVFVVRSKDLEINQEFLGWVFLSKYFTDFIDKLTAGSTIQHLYQKDIVSFEFPVPPSTDEQKAISSVLSIIDGEISSLKAKREKYILIKQGMMQELLTGKIRLV